MKFLVKFDLEFDLKFEISVGKNLVKFWGRTFLPASRGRNNSGRISGQISEKISETSFQTSRLVSETSFSRRAVLISSDKERRTAATLVNHSQICETCNCTLKQIPAQRAINMEKLCKCNCIKMSGLQHQNCNSIS